MTLPFTGEQSYGVFGDYNTAVWVTQWLLVALAVVALTAVPRSRRGLSFGASASLGHIAAGLVGLGLLVTAGQRHRALKS
jgi:hypothetical protein